MKAFLMLLAALVCVLVLVAMWPSTPTEKVYYVTTPRGVVMKVPVGQMPYGYRENPKTGKWDWDESMKADKK